MKNICKTICCILCLIFISDISILHAEDRSVIIIRIQSPTDAEKDTPAEMLLTDPQNRRTGFDAAAPFDDSLRTTAVLEIPRSVYAVQGISDNTGGGDNEPFYRELYVPAPIPGKYTIQIIGKKTGSYRLSSDFYSSDHGKQEYDTLGLSVAGHTVTINAEYSPVPGAPALVITKVVTFNALRQDLIVAQQLNQLGDEKFARSLAKNIDLAEKLAKACDKRGHGKNKPCRPAIAVLKLFVNRLELANRKCDSKNPHHCDEDKDWDDFGKEHRKDHDYDDFFREWDRDDWHKHKKTCKRFVTDEALKIIKDDAGWLIKSLGGETDKDREDHNGRSKDKRHD